MGDVVQTQTPLFMDLGLPTINTFDDSSDVSTPATRIWRAADGSHRSMSNNVFGEATSVGISVAKSDREYNYKNKLQICK